MDLRKAKTGSCEVIYADCGARTHDLGINSPTLHQLS